METTARLLDPAMLARLRRFPLRARWPVVGYVSGAHRAPFHGFSVEFADHRDYAPGDDLRYLDWKLYGRTDKYYLKQFEEETDLACYLLLDVSASMNYRSAAAEMSKLDYARRAAAALAYLVVSRQDGAGLAAFDNEVRTLLRPAGHPSHLNDLLEAIAGAEGGGKSSLGPVFHELAERLRRRGIVVILSDLLDDFQQIVVGLKHLRHRRHEVVLMHVLDPAEIDFPFDEPTLFLGLEDAVELPAEPRAIRAAYRAELTAYLRRIQAFCRSAEIDYVQMQTDRSLEAALAGYLSMK
ncbi:MAG: DUF58 domain-containing protein [Pirellulaceae bacterium]|nr:DUF58 domain-containing protein [Pirellulaceae bacterium]